MITSTLKNCVFLYKFFVSCIKIMDSSTLQAVYFQELSALCHSWEQHDFTTVFLTITGHFKRHEVKRLLLVLSYCRKPRSQMLLKTCCNCDCSFPVRKLPIYNLMLETLHSPWQMCALFLWSFPGRKREIPYRDSYVTDLVHACSVQHLQHKEDGFLHRTWWVCFTVPHSFLINDFILQVML